MADEVRMREPEPTTLMKLEALYKEIALQRNDLGNDIAALKVRLEARTQKYAFLGETLVVVERALSELTDIVKKPTND